METDFDVLIVGASLAGSAAAIRLRRSGLKVGLIDKATFPRRKPCGEGVSSFGLSQLELLGIKDSILELPHLRSHGYRIRSGDSCSIIRPPWSGNITIQRTILDAAILDKAVSCPNVTPFLSQQVTDIASNEVTLESSKLSAKRIILACGGTSPLLKKVPCRVMRSGPSRCGISVTFKGAFLRPPRYIQIILKKGYEIYCTPLAGGRLNISILKHADYPLDIRHHLLSAELLREVFGECSFDGVLELQPEGRTNIGNVRRYCSIPTISLAGDAKEEFDPIGGMGMSHALSSGIQAADFVTSKIICRNSRMNRGQGSSSGTGAMRVFTALTYQTLMRAKQFPPLLQLAASPISHGLVRLLTRELA